MACYNNTKCTFPFSKTISTPFITTAPSPSRVACSSPASQKIALIPGQALPMLSKLKKKLLKILKMRSLRIYQLLSKIWEKLGMKRRNNRGLRIRIVSFYPWLPGNLSGCRLLKKWTEGVSRCAIHGTRDWRRTDKPGGAFGAANKINVWFS